MVYIFKFVVRSNANGHTSSPGLTRWSTSWRLGDAAARSRGCRYPGVRSHAPTRDGQPGHPHRARECRSL